MGFLTRILGLESPDPPLDAPSFEAHVRSQLGPNILRIKVKPVAGCGVEAKVQMTNGLVHESLIKSVDDARNFVAACLLVVDCIGVDVPGPPSTKNGCCPKCGYELACFDEDGHLVVGWRTVAPDIFECPKCRSRITISDIGPDIVSTRGDDLVLKYVPKIWLVMPPDPDF